MDGTLNCPKYNARTSFHMAISSVELPPEDKVENGEEV